MKMRMTIVMIFIIMMIATMVYAEPTATPTATLTESSVEDPDESSASPTVKPSDPTDTDDQGKEVTEDNEQSAEERKNSQLPNPERQSEVKANRAGVGAVYNNADINRVRRGYHQQDAGYYPSRGSTSAAPPAKPQPPKFQKGNDASIWAKKVVEELKKEKLVIGYADGSFRMKIGASRQEVSAIVDRVLTALDLRMSKSEKEIKDAKDQIIAKIGDGKGLLTAADLTTALLPLNDRLKKIEDQLNLKPKGDKKEEKKKNKEEDTRKQVENKQNIPVMNVLATILVCLFIAVVLVLIVFLLPDPNRDTTANTAKKGR